jgi:hypothetical protein
LAWADKAEDSCQRCMTCNVEWKIQLKLLKKGKYFELYYSIMQCKILVVPWYQICRIMDYVTNIIIFCYEIVLSDLSDSEGSDFKILYYVSGESVD